MLSQWYYLFSGVYEKWIYKSFVKNLYVFYDISLNCAVHHFLLCQGDSLVEVGGGSGEIAQNVLAVDSYLAISASWRIIISRNTFKKKGLYLPKSGKYKCFYLIFTQTNHVQS